MLALLCLLLFSCATGSHFRGGTISWTRASPTSRTITARVIMHFYTGGIFPRTSDIRLRWGDGSSNQPSSSTTFLNGTWDETSTVRTIIYTEDHTYPALGEYTAYIYSVARQRAIINGPDRPYRVEAGVNLGLSTCMGSPAGIIPGVTYLAINPAAQFQIGASTTNAQPLQYTWYDNSALNLNPPKAPSGAAATNAPASPSYNGVLVNWDTSSGTAGSLYAVSVRADIVGVPKCHAVWDVTVQLEERSVPTCRSGGGSYTLFTTDSASYTFVGRDDEGGVHNAALIGDLPPGATFSSLQDTTEVTMDWSAPVSGSYAFTVQFCNSFGLCGACSVSVNVNDALPQVSIASTATVTDSGAVSFETLVENTSIGVEEVTVDSVSSSVDGDLSLQGCQVGVTVQVGGAPYNCTYFSNSTNVAENVISVQVSTTAESGIQSVAGGSSVVQMPSTTAGSTLSTDAAQNTASSSSSSSSSSTTASTTTDGASATSSPAPSQMPALTPQACGAAQGTRCVSDTDCGGAAGSGQAGLCTSNGFCQCAIGYAGVGTNLDPTACEYVCTPPPVADAVAFLNEPLVDSYADAGDLVLRVSIDPNLKLRPATIKMIHPVTGQVCGVLPDKLGLCELTQEVNPANCWTDYMWRRTTFYDVVENSGCFVELPNVTETGPKYTVWSRSFKTIYEVEMIGLAPFGQGGGSVTDETTVRRTLRREYTYKVATKMALQSDQFAIVADGLIQYRLVGIDVRPTQEEVLVTVQTRVIKGGMVSPLRMNATLTTGLPTLVRDVRVTPCSADSPDNYCDQFHSMTLSLSPCSADGELVLNGGLQCLDPDTPDDPVQCGFINVPVGNRYTLDNLLVQYDFCPITTTYGIDAAASFLRIFTDATRSVPVTEPMPLGSKSFGRCSVMAGSDSEFQSATLSALHLWRRNAPNNDDLGDQLAVAGGFMTMLSQLTNTDRLNPIWDFEVDMDFPNFDTTSEYYWEATVDVTFLQTGELRKKRINVVFDMHHGRALQEVARSRVRNDESPAESDALYSNVFALRSGSAVDLDAPSNDGNDTAAVPVVAIAAAAGAVVALVIGIILVVVLRKKRDSMRKMGSDAPVKTQSLKNTDVLDL